MILISILIAIIGIYLAIHHKGQLPDSVSSFVYELPTGLLYIWTIWLWLIFGLITPILLESISEPWTFVGFLTIVSAFICGIIPLTEKGIWHNILGVTTGILSLICVLLISPWWLLLWPILVILIGLMLVYDKPKIKKIRTLLEGKGILILEIVAALSLYGSLLL